MDMQPTGSNNMPPNAPGGTSGMPPPLPPVEPRMQTQRDSDKGGFSKVLSSILVLVAAPLIALFLTAFVFQSYEVDGPSMQSTLQDGDRLVVLKTAQTWAEVTNQPHIPERGDIIVFTQSQDAAGGKKQLIKRVIGLPGEHVVVRGGILTIYNDEHPEGFEPDKTLPYGEVIDMTQGNVDIIVPAGEVFVAGDNRGNSQDSRSFGTVPAENIVGTLYLRLLPLDKARRF